MKALCLLPLVLFSLACGSKPEVEKERAVAQKRLLGDTDEIELFKVSEAVWAREAKRGFAALSEPEKVFLCIWNLEAEVNNGGFEQFFGNSSGDYALQTPAALRQVGAEEMARLVEEAIQEFGENGPSPNRDRRSDQVDALSEDARERLNALDSQFFELASPEAELRDFVSRNRSEFFAP